MCLVSPWKRQGLEVWAFNATHRTRTGSQKRRRRRVESPSKGDVIKSYRLDGDGRRLEELTRREEKQKINTGNEGHACGSLDSVKRTPPSFSLLLSLNSWLFCCCCFSRSAKLLFTGKWNKKMTRVWKIKLKKMWKCLFALTGVGRRRTSARNIHRWTQEGNKLDATERSRIIRKEISGRWVHLSVHWRFWIESTFWYKTTKTTRSSIWLRGHSKKCGAQKDWCIRNRAHDGIIVHLKKWRNFFCCCKFQFFDTICFCFS
jgi:hypothetical protein